MVLGGHGDTMVPLPSHTSVGGIPLTELISKERIDAIITAHRQGRRRDCRPAQDRLGLLRAGVVGAVAMVESIVSDKKRVLPCASLLDGEYGHKDLYIGVPCVLGKGGVEKVIELKLDDHEKGCSTTRPTPSKSWSKLCKQ